MIIFYVLIIAFIGLMITLFYFFSLAFVRCKGENLEDINSEVNKTLLPYRETIKSEMNYIRNTPHKTVTTVSFDGLTLYADYYDNNSDKTAIIFHGYRSCPVRDFSCAVKMYINLGFNVLLCDQRSHGRSEGNIISFGVLESRDVKSWAEFITEKYSPNAILLGGMSMGATTVILSLQHNLPKTVRGVIADCGFTSPEEILKKVGQDKFKINVSFFLPLLNLLCKMIGKFSIKGVSTLNALKNSDLPVLFVHGKADSFVPCQMSEKAFAAANKNCRLLTVEGADHGLSYLVDKQSVENAISLFLKENGF